MEMLLVDIQTTATWKESTIWLYLLQVIRMYGALMLMEEMQLDDTLYHTHGQVISIIDTI